jgi:GDPmannose 4,6-dehydratase
MKTKAIIFGVTGQDGSHLTDLLLSKNYEVIGVARRCSVDTTERIKDRLECPHFHLAEGDITDAHSVIGVLKENDDVDEVYNLAAQSHVGISFKQPGLTWDITGKGCLNILQSLVDLEIDCRFYQASSSEMFGDSYSVDKDGKKYQDENTKFLPQSPYAIAKVAAHYMVRLFREAYGMHASAGILFNHEGERRGENFVTRKITRWISGYCSWLDRFHTSHNENILAFGKDEIYIRSRLDNDEGFEYPKLRLGNLDACRDWGYAGDYVEAMWAMLQQEHPDDYVICTGQTHSVREFLDYAFGYVGVTDWSNLVTIDPEFYRPAEVDYLCGNASKAKNRLGWVPKYGLEELVQTMMEHDLDVNLQSVS